MHVVLWIIHPVLAPIQSGHQTLEVHLIEAASTIGTISKVGDVTNAENMEYIGPKVNETFKERYFIRTYFRNTIPL